MIATYPLTFEFNQNQEQAFVKCLQDVSDNTELETISDPVLVTLDQKKLQTVDGYKLTVIALSQICSAISPGLSQAVFDVSGLALSERPISVPQAVKMYNDLVNFRYEACLSNKVLVRNVRTKTIDGIVGQTYKYLSNLDLYETTQANIRSNRPTNEPSFIGARLYGRNAAFYLQSNNSANKHVVQLRAPDNGSYIRAGYYFSNSEAGVNGVKVGWLIENTKTQHRAISIYNKGKKLVHAGRDFNLKLANAISTVLSAPDPTPRLQVQLDKLFNSPLLPTKLKVTDLNESADYIISKLTRSGISSMLAERIVYTALNQGSSQVPTSMDQLALLKSRWTTRTKYDLFVSVMREASNKPISIRETLENMAYNLLIEKIKI